MQAQGGEVAEGMVASCEEGMTMHEAGGVAAVTKHTWTKVRARIIAVEAAEQGGPTVAEVLMRMRGRGTPVAQAAVEGAAEMAWLRSRAGP